MRNSREGEILSNLQIENSKRAEGYPSTWKDPGAGRTCPAWAGAGESLGPCGAAPLPPAPHSVHSLARCGSWPLQDPREAFRTPAIKGPPLSLPASPAPSLLPSPASFSPQALLEHLAQARPRGNYGHRAGVGGLMSRCLVRIQRPLGPLHGCCVTRAR